MALGLLFLFLTLLGTVQAQDQDSNRTAEAESLLREIFTQQYFNYTWAQGKWYSLASANLRVRNGTNQKINMHSVIFNTTADRGYLLTAILYRPLLPSIIHDPHLECDQWTRKFSLSDHARIFNLEYPNRHVGLLRSTMYMIYTAYKQYVVVAIRHKFHDKEHYFLTAYGRTKVLGPVLKDHFVYLAKFLGFTEDNVIFFVSTDQCIDAS